MIIPCYPEFNIYSSVASNTTALGPIMIATIVNMIPGWEAEIIDENNYKCHGPRDAEGKPAHHLLQQIRAADVIGLYGGLTSTIPRLYEIASLYKEHGIVTIAGGQHFTGDNIQEALNNNIDYVVVEEGEETIKELLESLCTSKNLENIHGIAFRHDKDIIETPRRKAIKDLSRLPLPDFSLLRYAKITLYPVSWTRGCGMHCEFCTVKGKVRYGTVDYAFRQFTSVYERFGGKEFFIEDRLYNISPNDIFIINPREIHKVISLDGRKFKRLYLLVDPNMLSRITPSLYDFLSSCFTNRQLGSHNKLTLNNEELNLFLETTEKIHQLAPTIYGYESLLISYIIELMTYINQWYVEKLNIAILPSKSLFTPIIQTVIDDISLNFIKPLSLDLLAKRHHLNKYTLSRQFKKETGITLHKYLTAKRLNYSKQLLLLDIPITQAALDCGYQSYNHFSYVFKKEFDMTPRDYRKAQFISIIS
jgi:AraC-like DNA-binding protein